MGSVALDPMVRSPGSPQRSASWSSISTLALRALGVDRWREPAWAAAARGDPARPAFARALGHHRGRVAGRRLPRRDDPPAATLIAARRGGGGRHTLLVTATAIVAGTVVSGAVVFGTGAVEFSSRYLLAVGGILIGGAMTVAGVGGLTLRRALDDRWDEVEGWLALGATSRQSTIRLARMAASTALTPLVDQTKSTGIVVLPGTFVGAIFGRPVPTRCRAVPDHRARRAHRLGLHRRARAHDGAHDAGRAPDRPKGEFARDVAATAGEHDLVRSVAAGRLGS